jgi:hypothetical protein
MMLCATSSSARDASAPSREQPSQSEPSVGYSVRAGVEIGARSFAYSDPLIIATNLRPYDVTGVTLTSIGGSLRPFVWTHTPVIEGFTLGFDYAFAPTLASATTGGEDIQTTWDHGDIALHVPVRLGKHALAPHIGPTLGYGWLGFSFSTSGTLANEIPTVAYRFVRLGLAGSMTFCQIFSMNVGFDYLGATSGGAVYDRFRDVTLDGIDARLGFGVKIADGLNVNLLFDYTRFFSSFVPIPGDAYVAGGALDQFGIVKVGIEYGR